MRRCNKIYRMILVLGLLLLMVSTEMDCLAETADGEWIKDEIGWWYAYPDGTYARNTWLDENGKRYYLKSNGYMAAGWRKIDNKWYYFGGNGVMRTDWKKIGGKLYYFAEDGAMRTGWKKISGKWYYFAGDGAMRTGWLNLGGKRYLLASNGEMLTGWQFTNHRNYYFDPVSGAMKIGWMKENGNWYYFREDGTRTDCLWRIDGKVYYFDKNGVWIKNPVIPTSYDAEAALAFAVEHIQQDIDAGLPPKKCTDDWLCAEYVSNCLEAGGLTIYSPSSTYLRGMLDACPLVTTHVAKLDNGYLRKENVKGEIVPGDVISVYCPYETDGLPFIHTILFAGWDEEGVALEYAHNSRVFNATKRHAVCYSCGKKLEEVYISHFETSEPQN